jgi:hypothetical protein
LATTLCALYLVACARLQVEAQLVNRDHHGLEIVFMPDYLRIKMVVRLLSMLLATSPLRLAAPMTYAFLLCCLNAGMLGIVVTKQHSVTSSVWPSSIPLVNTGLRMGLQASTLCSVSALVGGASAATDDDGGSGVAVTVLWVGALLTVATNLVVHNLLASPDEAAAEHQNQLEVIEEQASTIEALSSKLQMFEARLRSLEHGCSGSPGFGQDDCECGLGGPGGVVVSPVAAAPLSMHSPHVRAITPLSSHTRYVEPVRLDRQSTDGTADYYDSDSSAASTCSHTSPSAPTGPVHDAYRNS